MPHPKVTLEEIQADVLNVLLESPECKLQRFQIRDKIINKYKYSGNSFDVVLQRKLNRLLVQGLIGKEDIGHCKVYYYIPKEKKKKAEFLIKKAHLKAKIDEASPEKIAFLTKKLEQMEKELEYQKKLHELRDLDELERFPLKFLLEKLFTLGFKLEDFYDRKHYSDREWEEIKKFRLPGDKLPNIRITDWTSLKNEGLDDIEIKIVDAKNPLIKVERVGRIPGTWGAWLRVTVRPVKGKHVYARYAKRVKLAKEIFEYELLKWKEDYNLTDEEWLELKPLIYENIQFYTDRVDMPIKIENRILEYLAEKPNALERIIELICWAIFFAIAAVPPFSGKSLSSSHSTV